MRVIPSNAVFITFVYITWPGGGRNDESQPRARKHGNAYVSQGGVRFRVIYMLIIIKNPHPPPRFPSRLLLHLESIECGCRPRHFEAWELSKLSHEKGELPPNIHRSDDSFLYVVDRMGFERTTQAWNCYPNFALL